MFSQFTNTNIQHLLNSDRPIPSVLLPPSPPSQPPRIFPSLFPDLDINPNLNPNPNLPPHPYPFAIAMASGLMFETSQHPTTYSAHRQERMTDWTPAISSMRRNDDEKSNPSTSFPHFAQAENSQHAISPLSHSFPISQSQSAQSSQSQGYSLGFSSQASHLHPIPPPRFAQSSSGTTYYPTGSSQQIPENLTTPARQGHAARPSSSQYTPTPLSYDATPGSGSMLSHKAYEQSPYTSQSPYASQSSHPIQQLNSVTRQDESTPVRDGERKKREKQPAKNSITAAASSAKTLKNAKRPKTGEDGGRAAKRIKVDNTTPGGNKSQLQLPTPPATGHDAFMVELPPTNRQSASTGNTSEAPIAQSNLTEADHTLPEASTSANASKRSGLAITRTRAEGRKLELVRGGSSDSERERQTPEEKMLSPRTATVTVLATDELGMAHVGLSEVLATEMAWMEDRAASGAPSPKEVDGLSPRTPLLQPESLHAEEITDTPATKGRKVDQRLQAFSGSALILSGPPQPMISTRVGDWGRLALRKDAAVQFLGLDANTPAIEETIIVDDGADGAQGTVASSSKNILKPNWPDQETPWLLAGGSRKARIVQEDADRTASIRRYLEAFSDESEEEQDFNWIAPSGKGKGKSVVRLAHSSNDEAGRPRRADANWETVASDAKSALLLGLRNRSIPTIPTGVVACVCGAQTTAGLGSMIACSACKTWHHLACYNLNHDSPITQPWWCTACESRAMTMATPAHSTPRTAYAQSEERSSAFKGESSHIALAPSPMFPSFNQAAAAARTPLSRAIASANQGSPSRSQRARVLSYGAEADMWSAFTEDGAAGSVSGAPSTPAPAVDRFSTPRVDDAPFDVTSTPSRHIDFNFGQPSLFSLTPLGGRSRASTSMLGGLGMGLPGSAGLLYDQTPTTIKGRNVSFGAPLTELGPSRGHEFFKELNRSTSGNGSGSATLTAPHTVHSGSMLGAGLNDMLAPLSPTMTTAAVTARRQHQGLLSAHSLSPLAMSFTHRRTVSGNKTSSLRSSSATGPPPPLVLGSHLNKDKGKAKETRQADDHEEINEGLGFGMTLESSRSGSIGMGGIIEEEDEELCEWYYLNKTESVPDPSRNGSLFPGVVWRQTSEIARE